MIRLLLRFTTAPKRRKLHLGRMCQYVWSGWDSNKMVEQFQDAMSTSPDAIALMGHPGVDALSSLVDEAERKGIIVTMQKRRSSHNQGKNIPTTDSDM